jgi:hypothetical protein
MLEVVVILLLDAKKLVKNFEVGPYAERIRGLRKGSCKGRTHGSNLDLNQKSKERAQFENRLAIDREIAARRAQTDAMFGPISSSYRA